MFIVLLAITMNCLGWFSTTTTTATATSSHTNSEIINDKMNDKSKIAVAFNMHSYFNISIM
ncbi:unnamed protein product, partial [Brugia pahangi]|uniref:Uncharacterized protein n=1 Tax=Brugia pahangi TaxID=6280 RepID=A0A0N4TFL2_BRUPA